MGRKIYNFGIEVNGVDVLLIQDVKVPEIEVGAVEHGATNYNEKTAGGVAVSDAELQKIMPVGDGDSWAWDWLHEGADMFAGGKLPEDYKRDLIFKEFAPDGITVLDSYLWEGCFCKKITRTNFVRGNQNENTIDTIMLSVDRVKKIA